MREMTRKQGAIFVGLGVFCSGTYGMSNEPIRQIDNIKASAYEHMLSPGQRWTLPATPYDRALVFRSGCTYIDENGSQRASTGDALFSGKGRAVQWRVKPDAACEVIVVDMKFNGPAPDGVIPASASQRNDGACKPVTELMIPVADVAGNSDEVLIDNAKVKIIRQTLYPGVPRPKNRREEDQITVFLDPATYILSPRDDAERARSPGGYICHRAGNEVQWFPRGQEVSTLTNVGPVSYRIDIVQIK